MKKIFCLPLSTVKNSEEAVKRVLSEYFGIKKAEIVRNENGKPFLKDCPLFISVSHTDELLFIGVCDENIGIDAEREAREVQYLAIVKKFPLNERKEILSSTDFLLHWVVKESAVKWLGGSLSHDLHKLRYESKKLFHGEIELPVKITLLRYNGHILSVCSERDFSNIAVVSL